LVLTVSPLLRDLVVAVLSPHICLDVIEVVESRALLADRLHALSPALVLIGLAAGESDAVALETLAAVPGAKVLLLAANAALARLYEAPGRCVTFTDFSHQDLIGALAPRVEG